MGCGTSTEQDDDGPGVAPGQEGETMGHDAQVKGRDAMVRAVLARWPADDPEHATGQLEVGAWALVEEHGGTGWHRFTVAAYRHQLADRYEGDDGWAPVALVDLLGGEVIPAGAVRELRVDLAGRHHLDV